MTISVPEYPSDVTIGGAYVLVALGALAEIVRINTEQNEAASPIDALGDSGTPCGRPQASITFGDGVAWFVCEVASIGRVNARTGLSLDIGLTSGLIVSSESASPAFSDVAFGLGSLWILNRNTNQVAELDPLTNLGQYKYTVGQEPEAIAVGTDSLWVANFEDDTVTRIAFTGGTGQPPSLETISVGDGPVDVAYGDGAVWVVNRLDASVTRIDEESGEPVATIEVGNEPQRIAAGEGSVWVTVRAPEEETLESDTTGP